MIRTDDNHAVFSFVSDTAGTFYYALGKAEPAKQPEQGEFSIVNAKGFTLPATDFFAEMGGFEIELNRATKEPLRLEDFTIICPKNGKLILGRLETEDNKTYKLHMKKGYNFVSGTTYNATIIFNNGTQASKKFFVDVWADDVTELDLKLTTDSALQVSFKAKENGKIYYDLTDEDQQNSRPKDPTELFEKGQVQEITTGYNILEGIVAKEGQWFRYAVEDELGNRMTRYGYECVPKYVPENKPDESEELKVTNIKFNKDSGYYGYGQIVITFNREVQINSANTRDVKITNVDGKFAVDAQFDYFAPTDTLKLDLRNVSGMVINSGEHQFTFRLTYEGKDGGLEDKIFIETFITD